MAKLIPSTRNTNHHSAPFPLHNDITPWQSSHQDDIFPINVHPTIKKPLGRPYKAIRPIMIYSSKNTARNQRNNSAQNNHKMGEDDGYLRTRNSVQLAKVELVDPSILTVPNNHIKNVETRIYYLAKQYKREQQKQRTNYLCLLRSRRRSLSRSPIIEIVSTSQRLGNRCGKEKEESWVVSPQIEKSKLGVLSELLRKNQGSWRRKCEQYNVIKIREQSGGGYCKRGGKESGQSRKHKYGKIRDEVTRGKRSVCVSVSEGRMKQRTRNNRASQVGHDIHSERNQINMHIRKDKNVESIERQLLANMTDQLWKQKNNPNTFIERIYRQLQIPQKECQYQSNLMGKHVRFRNLRDSKKKD